MLGTFFVATAVPATGASAPLPRPRTDLHIESVGIVYVKALLTWGIVQLRLKPPTAKFRFNGVFVSTFDSVGDMINARRSCGYIAYYQRRLASRKEALFTVVVQHFHTEQINIEIARLSVVTHLVRDVVYARSCKARPLCCSWRFAVRAAAARKYRTKSRRSIMPA